jgi:integrase
MADLAIATGLRQSNVFRLEWERVDLARRRLWIPARQAKGRKPIGIRLNDDAMRVLRAQHRLTKGLRWVFVGKDGANPPTEIKTAWKTACEAAGLKDFRWHDLRHTWATWHIMSGTPKEVLQRLGAWRDERMVNRYAHLSDSFVDEYAGNAKPYQPRHKKRHKAA